MCNKCCLPLFSSKVKSNKNLYMRKIFSVIIIVGMCILSFSETYASSQVADTVKVGEREYVSESTDSMILFRFWGKRKMFFMDYRGNRGNIALAQRLLRENMDSIKSGHYLISVHGYCSSYETRADNLRIAKNRSNQVKSYFITNNGMKERYYKTVNHPYAYQGDRGVVAMLELVRVDELEKQQETQMPGLPEESADTVVQALPEPTPEPAREEPIAPVEATERDVQRWALKTNAVGWAFVVPNLAAEWRFADHWSLDVPVYYSPYTVAKTYRFRTLSLQPSVRYWLRDDWRGSFFGVHLTGGQYNVSVKDDYRYQDIHGMWGAGIDYGYAVQFSKHWGMEFNIGAGMIYSKYNVYYNVDNGARRSTDNTKTYWGVTRCGISVVYKFK